MMKRKKFIFGAQILFAFAALMLWSCGHGHDHGDGGHDHGDAQGHDDHGEEAASVTAWSEKTELFMEYSPLVAGKSSDFLVHLTRLDTFQPIADVSVSVDFVYADTSRDSFKNASSKRSGIFRVSAVPPKAGSARLSVVVESPSYSDTIDCGEVQIYATRKDIPHSHGEEGASTVPFLKEQQWNIPFATWEAAEGDMPEGTPASFTVEALPGADAWISPLRPGLVEPPAGGFPRVGERVGKGQTLAYLVAAAAEGASLADLEADTAAARAEFQEADASFRRAKTLHEAEAISERQFQEAKNRAGVAAARLKAAEERLDAAQGKGAGGARLPLVSPIAGTLVESRAGRERPDLQSGMFRVARLDRVLLRADMNETDFARLGEPGAAEVEIPSGGAARLDRPAGMGGVVDSASRAIPVLFEADNAEGLFKIGLNLRGFLFSKKTFRSVSVPASAVLTEGGASYVYVQRGGEAFERRSVATGPRSGGLVAIVRGLQHGERVVSKGAYDVHLSALSGIVPEHGHAH